MIRIKVEYDKYTRTFKLLDREFGSILKDHGQYELLVHLMLDGVDEENNVVLLESTPLAHA